MSEYALSRERIKQADSYANRIRNPKKRQYAQTYVAYILNGQQGTTPKYDCSYMAAQSVRMELENIFRFSGF